MKKCTTCVEQRENDSFRIIIKTNKNGTQRKWINSQCKLCENALQKEYRKSGKYKDKAKKYRELESSKEKKRDYQKTEKYKKWRRENRNYDSEKKYKKTHKYLEQQKIYSKKFRDNLGDNYIENKLRAQKLPVTEELIKIKRLTIKINRLIKQK